MKKLPSVLRGFRSSLFAGAILTALLLMPSAAPRAGDEDGVAGYRFKIYDADGDGIDGNEGVLGGDASMLSTVDERVNSPLAQIRIEILVEQYLRNLVFWWLK